MYDVVAIVTAEHCSRASISPWSLHRFDKRRSPSGEEFWGMGKTNNPLIRRYAFAIVAAFMTCVFHAAAAQEGPVLTTEEIIELPSGTPAKGTGSSF